VGHSVKADHVVTAYEAVFEVITETGFSHTTSSAGPPESGIHQDVARIQSAGRPFFMDSFTRHSHLPLFQQLTSQANLVESACIEEVCPS